MNPAKLYTLTPSQHQQYQTQPDSNVIPNAESIIDEYELPQFVSQTAFRFWYNTQNEAYPQHWHDAQEIIVPVQGSYSITLQEKTYVLEPGDIFLVPPGELHALPAPEAGARFVFLLELNALAKLCNFTNTRTLLASPIHISAATHPEIYETAISLLLKMATFYWGNSPTKEMHIYSCLLDFYSCYTDYCAGEIPIQLPSENTTIRREASEKLDLALHFIEQHYAEDISLEDVAGQVGLSKYYFTRSFKRHTGQTFCEYLNALRISTAEKLLKETSLSISSICKSCGYSCISSFNRTFRRYKGYTPSEYRNIHSHEDE